MKAISLWQPWASLVAWGNKKNETRSWPTNYRGPIAIHATATWNKEATQFVMDNYDTFMPYVRKHPEVFPEGGSVPKDFNFPHGAIVCIVDLLDCIPTQDYVLTRSMPYHERAFGNYDIGRFVWRLKLIQKFSTPIPAKGHQGLWNWDG